MDKSAGLKKLLQVAAHGDLLEAKKEIEEKYQQGQRQSGEKAQPKTVECVGLVVFIVHELKISIYA